MSFDQPKDYRVKVTVRNNRILSLIERTHSSVAAFARDSKIEYQFLSDLICMRRPARTKNGEWSRRVLDVAGALGVDPDEMFTERQLAGLPRSSVIRHVNEEDVVSLSEQEAMHLLTTDDHNQRIYGKQIAELVVQLPNRPRFVIERRFGLNGHDILERKDIAELMGISAIRVGQLEARGIEMMRDKIRERDVKASINRLNIVASPPRKTA